MLQKRQNFLAGVTTAKRNHQRVVHEQYVEQSRLLAQHSLLQQPARIRIYIGITRPQNALSWAVFL